MKITVKRGDLVVYQQLLEDAKTLNVTVSHLMQQPQGTQIVTEIENNGHTLSFKNDSLNIELLIRRVNGIVIRGKARP